MTHSRETQYVLDLLVKNGWASSAAIIERGPNSHACRVMWTDAGKVRVQALLILISDLERQSGRLHPGEFEVLNPLLELFANTHASTAWPKALPTLPAIPDLQS